MTLSEAIIDVIDAKREHDVARADYDGGSWGYHGHVYIMRVHTAEVNLNTTLAEIVNEAIAKSIGVQK